MQWLMLQQDNAKDYVIATGRAESVRHFAEISAAYLGWGNGQTLLCMGRQGVNKLAGEAIQ